MRRHAVERHLRRWRLVHGGGFDSGFEKLAILASDQFLPAVTRPGLGFRCVGSANSANTETSSGTGTGTGTATGTGTIVGEDAGL